MAKSGSQRRPRSPRPRGVRKGKYGGAESAAVVAAATRRAAALGLTVADLVVDPPKVIKRRHMDDTTTDHQKTHEHNVWRELAETEFPERTALSLYSHVKRQCHPDAHRGPWTAAETSLLGELYARRGPQWSVFAGELHRTPESCRDRYRQVFGEPEAVVVVDTTAEEEEEEDDGLDDDTRRCTSLARRGAWTSRETSLFESSTVGGVPILDVKFEDVSFSRLARRVGTRTVSQCRRRWLAAKREARVNNKSPEDVASTLPARLLQTYAAHRLDLCERALRTGADREEDVPWSKLGYDAVGSGTSVARRAFAKMRREYCEDDAPPSAVPGLPFRDLLETMARDLRAQVHSETLRRWKREDREQVQSGRSREVVSP